MPLTFRDRALGTIHQALIVAGGSYLDMHVTRASHFRSSYVPHYSVQIHHGWPSKPIGNNGWGTVSYSFHNFIFHIATSS